MSLFNKMQFRLNDLSSSRILCSFSKDFSKEGYSIQEVTDVLDGLEENLKVPFSLFLSGYQYEEIADKLEVSVATIKSRIFFAKQELQLQQRLGSVIQK